MVSGAGFEGRNLLCAWFALTVSHDATPFPSSLCNAGPVPALRFCPRDFAFRACRRPRQLSRFLRNFSRRKSRLARSRGVACGVRRFVNAFGAVMKKLPLLFVLLACACTPAVIAASVAFGGATVAVTYETLGSKPDLRCGDAGID